MESSRQQNEATGQSLFLELKAMCMPLLEHSRLDNQAIPKVLTTLSDLTKRLQKLDKDRVKLKPGTIVCVFFPLSAILRYNDSSNIPDQVLERIFNVFELLFRWWWWMCEEAVWEQVLMLAGSVVGGLSGKGKGRERDDETKEAAARLLLCLLRDRSNDEDIIKEGPKEIEKARIRLNDLQTHAHLEKLVPVLGQTLNSLLITSTSEHLPLQLCSLRITEVIVSIYVPSGIVPSILPGVVSTATRVALGKTSNIPKSKTWVNSAVVSASLRVLDAIVIRALGDDVCLATGAVKEFTGLEDLTELVSGDAAASSSQSNSESKNPYETTRSATWLRASSSQLLIALNTLAPLVSHPTPLALLGLSSLSQSLLSKAHLTLSDARPLLLSFLLSLSNSRFPSVSSHARTALSTLLTPPAKGSYALLQTLLHQTAENLSALPRLLPTQADAKIEHIAGQVEAACRLSVAGGGVGRLLGPTGHIEKWGWRLLSVLDFAPLSASISAGGAGVVGLLQFSEEERIVFPAATLRYVATHDAFAALERMLRSLGAAGGDTCLFAVEWFVRVAVAQRGNASAAAALWCACRILEGVVGVALDGGNVEGSDKKGVGGGRVEKHARWLAKTVSEFWDIEDEDLTNEKDSVPADDVDDGLLAIEYTQGLTPLQTRFDFKSSSKSPRTGVSQPILHKSFSLQLLAVSANILRSRFSTLLIYTLYPLLHSLVSPEAHLSSTAFAALQHVTRSLGYATPGNLLLSNFDYALDSVSRRLTRRWLDVDAARVLAVLVRLVGRDVVQRAGDVVEECFDRLDDFHGYTVVVEGLVEALHEVVKVVEAEEFCATDDTTLPAETDKTLDRKQFEDFLHWVEHHNGPKTPIDEEEEDFCPPPREAWGKGKSKETSSDNEEEKRQLNEPDTLGDPPPTPAQALTAQIVARSISLLTHGSLTIRVRILTLLAAAAPVLPASALLPAVHRAWPFVLNRLGDAQTPVVSAAAAFVAALARAHRPFMAPRIWDDVWPRFRSTLAALDNADTASALARRTGLAGVGTESAYTHSHRLYRAMLETMATAPRGGVQIQDRRSWDVLVSFRRFLHKGAHEELQAAARELYVAFGEKNEDAVWLVLASTVSTPETQNLGYLGRTKWDIQENFDTIMTELSSAQQEETT
ncbi:hypothetical protein M0805_009245 [Coniferiporia weirii]|nr:hypothetical protein M0805_009245 [Coniferiporia weirii]